VLKSVRFHLLVLVLGLMMFSWGLGYFTPKLSEQMPQCQDGGISFISTLPEGGEIIQGPYEAQLCQGEDELWLLSPSSDQKILFIHGLNTGAVNGSNQ